MRCKELVIQFFLPIALYLLMAACSQKSVDSQPPTVSETAPNYIYGQINDITKVQVLNVNGQYEKLVFHSPGGYPSGSMVIADEIIKHKYVVDIDTLCVSACAEYILPAANAANAANKDVGVNFINKPIIGFHWNAMMIEHEMRTGIKEGVQECDFSSSQQLKSLQVLGNVNPAFWKATLKKLGTSKFQYQEDGSRCPKIKMGFENEYWLPTSNQLSVQFKLNFNGEVCADDFDFCAKKS